MANAYLARMHERCRDYAGAIFIAEHDAQVPLAANSRSVSLVGAVRLIHAQKSAE